MTTNRSQVRVARSLPTQPPIESVTLDSNTNSPRLKVVLGGEGVRFIAYLPGETDPAPIVSIKSPEQLRQFAQALMDLGWQLEGSQR